ncbi:hypothetical protein M0R04_04795 [Candidatus Dojkabacteria bacterium]|jgi:hypothetical protein|nr:hypothetical protein [Candidatus Dojkabacteria bacterium]
MTLIQIEIDKCVDNKRDIKCPFVSEKLTKGYGYAIDYMCSLKNNRVTSGYVEWDRDIQPIPSWCPIRVK